MGFHEAKLARVQASAQQAAEEPSKPRAAQPATPVDQSFALLGSAPATTPQAATATPAAPAATDLASGSKIEQACVAPLAKLIEELNLCRRYHEATFSNKPVGRLIFVGGEARQRWMCQHIARSMQLAAQIGDPLVRMGRTTEVSIESGIDRRQPQPAWAVALGLSMGPIAGTMAGYGSVTTNTERAERRGAA